MRQKIIALEQYIKACNLKGSLESNIVKHWEEGPALSDYSAILGESSLYEDPAMESLFWRI